MNLQGSDPNLQGSYGGNLQPAGNPQQATGLYGPVISPTPAPAPTIAAPKAPTAPAAPRAATSVQVAQPDAAINSIFQPFIGSRSSTSNPGVLEYYNKQTGQGFSNPNDLFSYASSLGAE